MPGFTHSRESNFKSVHRFKQTVQYISENFNARFQPSADANGSDKMKQSIPQRKPENFLDYVGLAITTFGVGYLPLAPGTWGSMVGVLIYLGVRALENQFAAGSVIQNTNLFQIWAWLDAFNLLIFIVFCLIGVWAAGRSTSLLGSKDPSQAVVDEVIGQLIVFMVVPFDISWKLVVAGFLLFRLFDIWKPYPIRSLENLPDGLGICADDIVAGIYAGAVLSFIYADVLSF